MNGQDQPIPANRCNTPFFQMQPMLNENLAFSISASMHMEIFEKSQIINSSNACSQLTSTASVPWSMRSILVSTPNVLSPEFRKQELSIIKKQ